MVEIRVYLNNVERVFAEGKEGVRPKRGIIIVGKEVFINYTDGKQEHYSGFPYTTIYKEEKE